MIGLLVTVAAAQTVGVREAEGAWWPLYGDVAPGGPQAIQALEWWLATYRGTGSRRVEVAELLLWAHQQGDARTTRRAWVLAREPLFALETARAEREVRHLWNAGGGGGGGGGGDLDLGAWFGQLGFVGGVAAGGGAPIGWSTGGTAMVGPAVDLFGLEGVVGAGVTATIDPADEDGTRAATLRGELLAGVGGDGVLLWAGAGYGSTRVLHQLLQLELTTDGDQPWPFLALRVEVEESVDVLQVGGRALVLIGAKIGETPD